MNRHLAQIFIVAASFFPVAACAQSIVMPPNWDIEIDSQVGLPSGYIQVRENELKGTHLRLRDDLGIDTSEVLSLTARYRFTSRDAARATVLYYFLDGTAHFDREKVWDGQLIGPGDVTTSLDFWRATLAYERILLEFAGAGRLAMSLGATYVHLNAKIGRKAEDFYFQELPVPVAGLRLDYELTDRLAVSASIEGGGLPTVDSLRNEGGTVWLDQHHADTGLILNYVVTPHVSLGAGYHFTYFFQHEHSKEDGNRVQLIDNALRLHVDVQF